jgi:hypothetical protein
VTVPYELTITESMQDFWHSAFHSQDRIYTSRPFARTMGLQDKVLPFPLALFLTSSCITVHSHGKKAPTAPHNVIMLLSVAFTGDTFTKSFQVKSVRNTSDGNHSVRTGIEQQSSSLVVASRSFLCAHTPLYGVVFPPRLFNSHVT